MQSGQKEAHGCAIWFDPFYNNITLSAYQIEEDKRYCTGTGCFPKSKIIQNFEGFENASIISDKIFVPLRKDFEQYKSSEEYMKINEQILALEELKASLERKFLKNNAQILKDKNTELFV